MHMVTYRQYGLPLEPEETLALYVPEMKCF